MPLSHIVTTVMLAAFGFICVYFVDYNRRTIQNTPHSYEPPPPQPRPNRNIVAGYDSKPRTSNSDDRSTVRQREIPSCAICLEEVRHGFTTPCGHKFHHTCIDEYLENKSGESIIPCPICRKNIATY